MVISNDDENTKMRFLTQPQPIKNHGPKNAHTPHIPEPDNQNGTFPRPPLKPEMYPRQFNPISGDRPGMPQYHHDGGIPPEALQALIAQLRGQY